MSSASTIRLCVSYLLLLWSPVAWPQVPPPSCGTLDDTNAATLRTFSQQHDLSRLRTAQQELLEYRLALDINYQTYQQYKGDTALIKSVAYGFIDKASAIFERDIGVKLTVSTIHIWKSPEPYALSTDMDYYNNILTYWNMHRSEPRDAVVSLSVRGGWFYGGYRMCTSNFPGPTNPTLSVDLLAHELGHTLGSPHTHSCSWPGGPIDYCEIVESNGADCQSQFKEYTNGTLMSYCRSVLRFHPLCQSLMRSYAEGKIATNFRLKTMDSSPPPADLQIVQSNDNLPIFQWPATLGAYRFQLQIAQDGAFTNIVADTLLSQAFYRSTGLGQGQYMARYRIQTTHGSGAWSPASPFTVRTFSAGSEAPLMLQAELDNKGLVTGTFKGYPETDSYQVMFINLNYTQQFTIYERAMQENGPQYFSLPLNMPLYGWYGVKLRVGKAGVWTDWGELRYLSNPWNGRFLEGNTLTNATARPLIATTYFQPTTSAGLQQSIEIATDKNFQRLVYSDSSAINQMQERFSNKINFSPQLAEHTVYYARTRLQYAPGQYTPWDSTRFQTGWNDSRFKYLGTVTPKPMPTNSYSLENNSCRFFQTDRYLYVYTANMGYYASADMKNWEDVTVSKSKGKSPDFLRQFAATDESVTYTLDQTNVLTRRMTGTYQNFPGPEGFYTSGLSNAAISESDGVFFSSRTKGVAHFKNGSWQLYGKALLGSDNALVVANSESGIWAVMEGGMVWCFQQNQWVQRPSLPQWQGIKGLLFDPNGQAYAYGTWGASRLSPNQQAWEQVAGLANYPIAKMLLDSSASLWAASYKVVGVNVQDQALIKLSQGQTTVYNDGLAFLREPFDIAYFKNKLYILTTGAELHSFDESNIQRFDPQASYCIGDKLPVSLTSNSTQASSTDLSIELLPEKAPQPPVILASEAIRLFPFRGRSGTPEFLLSEDIAPGTYRLRTVLEHPDLRSPVSEQFYVSQLPQASIALGAVSPYATPLLAPEGKGFQYEWLKDGELLAREKAAILMAYEDGNYRVRITNAEGCSAISPQQAITVEHPSQITLLQNSPNPAISISKIDFYTPIEQPMELELFDIRGIKVRALSQGVYDKGWHSMAIDVSALPSGTYIYRLSAEDFRKSLKLFKP
ncbi:putative secreted protein (Por secretion system target) [Dyadobacter jejuensis]|uniref:Putative secreted protein (Por secretion system target) n=1 Tax=Dyadobacter jejuensis TaxID=1082580 RepID=A0A316AH15_9BACT|nr:M12 family metallo-peptidase [Dyadobacter jejuensis]PWJ56579.1 putative secreted protein (Por secretion system target) [Dyadobacter jejuensis]